MTSSCWSVARVAVILFLAVVMFLNAYLIFSNNPTFFPTLLRYHTSIVNRVEIGIEKVLGKCQKKQQIMFLKTHKV